MTSLGDFNENRINMVVMNIGQGSNCRYSFEVFFIFLLRLHSTVSATLWIPGMPLTGQ
jgi:hypothetical protein